ncbi:unnamed protein product, partial [marine sediment metagenome]
RWKIFVKWLLAIPHFIVLMLYGIAYFVTLIIAWFAILFTGRYPRGLFDFAVGLLRWSARVDVYTNLMRDEYPPFGTGGDYPVRLEVEYPERLSRWKIFVKGLMAIPHMIILYGYSILASVITFVAFFIILFTGRYPRALFDLVVGYYRWNTRVYAYVLLLTDEYPPFTNA